METAQMKSKGFTLIEVMIVVVIVGILAAIAYPSYQQYVISGNRTDGRATLLNTAQALERCFTQFSAYNNASCTIANGATINSSKGLYTIGVVSAATTYTLTATPVAGKMQARDTRCTTITLNNLGVKGGTGAEPARCW